VGFDERVGGEREKSGRIFRREAEESLDSYWLNRKRSI